MQRLFMFSLNRRGRRTSRDSHGSRSADSEDDEDDDDRSDDDIRSDGTITSLIKCFLFAKQFFFKMALDIILLFILTNAISTKLDSRLK